MQLIKLEPRKQSVVLAILSLVALAAHIGTSLVSGSAIDWGTTVVAAGTALAVLARGSQVPGA